MNGLNWHVQVEPLSLSMTSLPPTLPVFAGVPAAWDDVPDDDPEEVPDELFDELPPHAATSTATAPSATRQLNRFISPSVPRESDLRSRRVEPNSHDCGKQTATVIVARACVGWPAMTHGVGG